MDCDGDPSKRVRKRKTTLYAQICKQMEFYFGDANLQKDRFLTEKLSQSADGYIELSLFLTFNRIRKFTTKTRDIANALKKSDFLQLDDDGLRVKRTTAVKKPENTDDRTVYVECLPVCADHDWVKRVFSPCGNITYVSIPKYHTTGDSKGFAFVEFESEDAAHKACELLNNPPASLDDRPGKFPKWNKTLANLQMQIEKNKQEPEDKIKADTQTEKVSSSKAGQQSRKHNLAVNGSPSCVEGNDCKCLRHESSDILKPRSSLDQIDVSNVSDKTECDNPNDSLRSEGDGKNEVSDSRKRKRKRRKSDKKIKAENEKDSGTVNSSTVTTDDKQRRKRKRPSADAIDSPIKKARGSSVELTKKDAEKGAVTAKRKKRKKSKKRDPELPELRVISKAEWLALKKEYICVQKANMADLKKTLKECKEHMSKTTHESASSLPSKIPSAVAMVTNAEKTPEFIANVIVKVHGPHPLIRKQLKSLLPGDVNVAYIDVQDGISNDGYIRCKDAESADKLITVQDSDNTFTLVTGSEEESYWNKLKADRETKLSSTKRGKKRGMQKLVERAERIQSEVVQRKHVVFADE